MTIAGLLSKAFFLDKLSNFRGIIYIKSRKETTSLLPFSSKLMGLSSHSQSWEWGGSKTLFNQERNTPKTVFSLYYVSYTSVLMLLSSASLPRALLLLCLLPCPSSIEALLPLQPSGTFYCSSSQTTQSNPHGVRMTPWHHQDLVVVSQPWQQDSCRRAKMFSLSKLKTVIILVSRKQNVSSGSNQLTPLYQTGTRN